MVDNDSNVPDISEVDFDTRLKVLLGVPPEREREEVEDDTISPPTESGPDK